uniref:DUF659 domain-containing protein n=1 Tax=Rhizophagus irregularis (strain DAOM 181602 / DAOM 197198 / MUCL 43194) TaxID=747089 RepID=U9UVU1_RHIID
MSESKNPISFILKKPNAKPGRKPKEVWNFFTAIGEKKEGHRGCKCKYCPWSQTRGEPSSMEAHLALSCHKTPQDVKEKFLLIVKTRGESQTLQLEAAEIPSKKRKAGHQQLITKISFRLVEHPFFIDMVKSLCLGYDPPRANTLSQDFLYEELANIVVDQHLELKRTTNLTLGFDSWTSPLGQSLYAFVIMTPDRKEIIHCIKNLSANSHTANFLADQLNEVITEVGAENFAAVVSDHASACAAAKKRIAERYKHILPIRCIAHHMVNETPEKLSTDISELI